VRISFPGNESVLGGCGNPVAELFESAFFVAIVKPYRICEALDGGAGPGFQNTFALAELESSPLFRKVHCHSMVDGVSADGHFAIPGDPFQLGNGHRVAPSTVSQRVYVVQVEGRALMQPGKHSAVLDDSRRNEQRDRNSVLPYEGQDVVDP